MSELLLAGVFLLVLIALYAIGVPVAYAIGVTSLAVMLVPLGPTLNWQTFSQRIYAGTNSFVLLAIPFFLLAGRIMNATGMTEDIFDFAQEAASPLPGGLGHVNVVVSMIFSGMSGAAVADAAGLGSIEYKAMTERGYDPELAAGITGASSTIGPIIPPSIPIIVYGVIANVSIGGLFIAGIIPGLLMGLSLMVMVTIITVRAGSAEMDRYNVRSLASSTARALPALLTPVIIIGGIMFGVFTPTESAVVAVIYALLLGAFYYRALSGSVMYDIFRDTFIDTAALVIIIGMANLYGFLLVTSGIPAVLTEQIVALTDSRVFILFLLVGALLLLGTFMETLAIILVTVPILNPMFPSLGIDPLFFGIVMMIALMIGLITPPFGVVLFALGRVTDLEMDRIMRGITPFYPPLIAVLVLIILFPGIVLFLPSVFGFA